MADIVKDLMMRSFWISQVALNPVTNVLLRGGRGEDLDTKERALKEEKRLESATTCRRSH